MLYMLGLIQKQNTTAEDGMQIKSILNLDMQEIDTGECSARDWLHAADSDLFISKRVPPRWHSPRICSNCCEVAPQ